MKKLNTPFYKPGIDIISSDAIDSSKLLIDFLSFCKENLFLFKDSNITVDDVLAHTDIMFYFNNSESGRKFREYIIKELINKNKLKIDSMKSISELICMDDIIQNLDDKNRACTFYEMILPKYYPYLGNNVDVFMSKVSKYCEQKSTITLYKQELAVMSCYKSYIQNIFSAIINEHITKIINLLTKLNFDRTKEQTNKILTNIQ